MILPGGLVFTLELGITEGSIAGCLIDHDGHKQLFTGWLGLTHALTAALAQVRAHQCLPDPGEPHEHRIT